MEFDAQGNFIKAFGAGTMLFPHGFFIDRQDHLWITDGHVARQGKKIGDDVLEFDQNGKLLRTLGQPGVSGERPDTFHEPNAVLVAPDGSIFVTDGHAPDKGNARVIKFDANGKFLMQWGEPWQRPRPVRDAALPGDGFAAAVFMSATAAMTASRSSPKTASFLASSASSAGPAASPSTAMTSCIPPTPNPARRTAMAIIRAGSAVCASAA